MSRKRILWVVNGKPGGAMDIRTQGLSRAFAEGWSHVFLHRPEGPKLAAARFLSAAMKRLDFDAAYVMDMGFAGVSAALWRSLWRRRPLIVDTGDAITALARAARLRGSGGIAATWLLEETALRGASQLVVRGSYHQELLAARGLNAVWIPDGFEEELFYPPAQEKNGPPTIGLLGSITWSGSLEATYGWDLVEALAQPSSRNWRGIVVGDGSGWERLKEFAHQRGVLERIEFPGRIAYADLRPWLHRMDVCLSTQSNDLPGQVRTTGKLPLYLACGRYILASRVGEASRVLPDEMLVDYQGSLDYSYPQKLAARLKYIEANLPACRLAGRSLATTVAPRFSYRELGRVAQEMVMAL